MNEDLKEFLWWFFIALVIPTIAITGNILESKYQINPAWTVFLAIPFVVYAISGLVKSNRKNEDGERLTPAPKQPHQQGADEASTETHEA